MTSDRQLMADAEGRQRASDVLAQLDVEPLGRLVEIVNDEETSRGLKVKILVELTRYIYSPVLPANTAPPPTSSIILNISGGSETPKVIDVTPPPVVEVPVAETVDG